MKQTVDDIVRARRLIEGPRDLLRSISSRKYAWTKIMSETQEKNRWFASQVNVSRDSLGYATMRKGSKQAYKRALAFLSNLDAIQCDNLAENLYPHITDPHVQECIATQVAEEWIHVKAYSTLIETVVKDDALEIYQMYKDVPALGAKNDRVIAQGKKINQDDGESFGHKFVKALVSNMVLEGVYFFSGFSTIYAVGRDAGGSIQGSVDMVKYIHRDEDEHLWMFQNMWHDMRNERPELFTPKLIDECKEIIIDGVNLERSWGHLVIQDGVPLLDEKRIDRFIGSRGEHIAAPIGLGGLFDPEHDLKWFDDYQMNKGHKNFFEGRVGTYQHDSLKFNKRGARGGVNIGSMIGTSTIAVPAIQNPVVVPASAVMAQMNK